SADLEALYAFGHQFLINGKYAPAADVFALLTMYSPRTARYWCALGAAAHGAGALVEALKAYALALELDPQDALARQTLAAIFHQARNSAAAAAILNKSALSGSKRSKVTP